MAKLEEALLTDEQQSAIITLGREAEALKDNKAFQRICDAILNNVFMEWIGTPSENHQRLHDLHATVRALDAIRVGIEAAIGNATVEIDNRERMKDEFRKGMDNN